MAKQLLRVEKTYTRRYVDELKGSLNWAQVQRDDARRLLEGEKTEVIRLCGLIETRMQETERLYQVIRAGLTK